MSMNKGKRLALKAGAALLAMSAGAYFGWRRLQSDTSIMQVPDSVWPLAFSDLKGNQITLRHYQGQSVLINFWATWCPPCVAEMPLLNAFYKKNRRKGIQVLGVAIDQQQPVQAFVQHNQIVFPVVLGGANGIGLSQILGNAARALPFSVWVQADGTIGMVKMGELNVEALKKIGNGVF